MVKAYVIFRNGEVFTSMKGKVIHHDKRHADITVSHFVNDFMYSRKRDISHEFTIKTYELKECE